MTRGERNKNPGNINKGQGFKGEVDGDDPRFATFESDVMGIRAITIILLAYWNKHNINTVQGIIGRWAPSIENNTSAYAIDVANRLDIAMTDTLDMYDPETLVKLTKAIIFHENGRCNYSDQTIEDAVKSAIG